MNGTLLLEEIGDLSFRAQSALWHLLMRAPGPVHLIVSTHMSLTQAVREGRFRSDLLHLLSEQHLTPPPLRDRADDLVSLAERFRQEFLTANQQVVGFSETSLAAMRRHRWPGNLRELRNRIERAMLVAESAQIGIRDLGIPTRLVPA
jgi:DNA-binding NtrC family response regulator